MFDIYPVGGHVLAQIEFPHSPRAEAGQVEEGSKERVNEWKLRAKLAELACLHGVDIDDQIKVLRLELSHCERQAEPCAFAEASGILQLSGPCGVATDGEGRLIVLDWERERLQLLANDGTPFVSCALASSGAGGGYTEQDLQRASKMMEPCAVTVDDAGNVAAINSDLKAVVVYSALRH